MRRVLHLSDLHYGKDRPDLETPLLETIARIAPDLVVVSGDLTQRARVSQFDRARQFLARLDAPWLSVPGNHDTPLDNLWLRFFAPWQRYRAAISAELEPVYQDAAMRVVGVNTVNRFAWQRGRLSDRRIKRACAGFADAGFADTGAQARLVVLHHPLQHAPEERKRLTRGADEALRAFANCGAQIVLSGHVHSTWVAPFRAWPQLLFVQAGTSLSSRVRGESNMFNLLELTPDAVTVESWSAQDQTFAPLARHSFAVEDGIWVRREG